MVQVIQLHPYNGSYPFGIYKQTQLTYVQVIKEIQSQSQSQRYQHNLGMFKLIQSQQIIKLDSYVKQSTQLQLYYLYEPISIKIYISQRLSSASENSQRERFLARMLNNINSSIESIIAIMMDRRILALLSIQNMAIAQGQKIKFFIQPDFQLLVQHSGRTLNVQLNQFYHAEKKKLQLQLQEFLEAIFNPNNTKKQKQIKKPNFIIQGTKLVFAGGEQQSRKSNMSGITEVLNTIKPVEKVALLTPSQCKAKFDIKNILDQKKLQKNQVLQPKIQSATKQPNLGFDMENFDKQNQKVKQTKKSFVEMTQNQKQKQIKNYFQNNDDFNKDTSFYPEEFVIDDSIAEFDGYEEELQRQVQDLKKNNLQAQIQSPQKNRLSMTPNSYLPFEQQKMFKPSHFPQGHQQASMYQPTHKQQPPNNQQQQMNLSSSQQQDTSTDHKLKKKYKVKITTSHQVNVEDGDEFDMKEIEKEIIQDIKRGNIKTDQQGDQLSPKNNYNSNVKSNNQKLFSPPLFVSSHSKNNQRETHHPSSFQQVYGPYSSSSATYQNKNSSLNYIAVTNTSNSSRQQYSNNGTQDRPFSKFYQQGGTQTTQNQKSNYHNVNANTTSNANTNTTSNANTNTTLNANINTTLNANTNTTLNANTNTNNPIKTTPDVRKIIQKIKNTPSQHHSLTPHYQQNTLYNLTNLKLQIPHGNQNKNNSGNNGQQQQQKQGKYSNLNNNEDDHRPHSKMSNFGNNLTKDNQQPEQAQHDKDYFQKIQKAKMKAEQIMRQVRERKVQ